MLFRLVTIRNHKNVIFCDSFDEKFNKIQLMIPSGIFNDYYIKVGSVIEAKHKITTNKYGSPLYLITEINNVMNQDKTLSYKSINTDLSSLSYYNFISALNGGENLKFWEIKQRMLEEIRNFLLNKSFLEVNTPPLMNNRGTSIVNPLRVDSQYLGEKYLKITHELELKKLCYLTLKSLFEIGYVTRDVYTTSKAANQYLTLELVSPLDNDLSAEEFYLKVYEFAINLAKEYGISYSEIFNNIEVKDVLELYLKTCNSFNKKDFLKFYKCLLKEEQNIIYINAPIDTPLAIDSEYGIPLETKWAIGERGIGHGYYDQSDLIIIKNAFEHQQRILKQKGIDANMDVDYLKVLEYAGIDTKSLNLGIDRFMYKFLDLDHEEKAIKVLGL